MRLQQILLNLLSNADSAAVVVALALVTREMKRMPHVDEPVAADTLV